ncbi:hypothetical protein H072_7588 [Dactylellina haptotyla CBS 200.50]|uniref:NACHT domain-containing protein n=1 Tax=Dactylellina haptotyla (strain CBS 200.50) TaxID=1284197 RepID=S8BTN0_DACHA|nr:hypothetical protein H072_7588 [Dactylellina haptotyla CBS 200.50]
MVSAQLLQDALTEFKQRLNDEQKKEFSLAKYADVEYTSARLQEELRQSKSYKALGLLQPFVEGLSGYAKVIEVFAQTSEILAFVWGPIKFLLQVVSTTHRALEKLMDALAAVGEKLLVYGHCSQLAVIDVRFRPILVRVYKDILDLLWMAMRTFKKNLLVQALEMNLPLFDRKLRLVLSNLANDEEIIHKAISAVGFKKSLDAFDEAFAFHQKAEAEFNKAAKHRRTLALQTFYQILKPQTISLKLLEASRKLVLDFPNAGSWLSNHPTVTAWTDWSSSSPNLLALYGIPGAGKTTLSSMLYNKLEDCVQTKNINYGLLHLAITFHFSNSSCETVLKSLLYSQLIQCPEEAEIIFDTLGSQYSQKLQSLQTIQEISEQLFQLSGPTFLFIDGLDELNEDREIRDLLKFVEKLLTKCPNLRIFLSCRAEDVIKTKWEALKAAKIRITDTLSAHDMRVYVNHPENIEVLVDYGFEEDQAKVYLDAIITQAKGMFLYAKLMLLDIRNQMCYDDIEKLLSELPKDINQAYDWALKRIANHPDKLREAAIKVFKLLLASDYSFRAAELEQGIMIEPNMSKFMPGRKLRRSLTSLCGSLIEVATDSTVSLVHSSLKDYLLKLDTVLQIRPTNVQFSLSKLCLEYLQLRTLYLEDDEAYEKCVVDGEFAFLTYVCKNLSCHLQSLVILKNSEVAGMTSVLEGLLKDLIDQAHLSGFYPTDLDVDGDSNIVESGSLSITVSTTSFSDIRDSTEDIISTLCSTLCSQELQDLLGRFILRLNSVLQKLSLTGPEELKNTLQQIYGALLRCRDVKCSRLFDGFVCLGDFTEHLQSHDKAFRCKVETCPSHWIGFGSTKALNAHIKATHSNINDPQKAEKMDRSRSQKISSSSLAMPGNIDEKFRTQLLKEALVRRDFKFASEILDIILERDVKSIYEMKTSSSPFNQIDAVIAGGTRLIFKPQTRMDYILYYGSSEMANKVNARMQYIGLKYPGYDHFKGILNIIVAILGGNLDVLRYIGSRYPEILNQPFEGDTFLKIFNYSLLGGAISASKVGGYISFSCPLTFFAAWVENENILAYLLQQGCHPHTIDYPSTSPQESHSEITMSRLLVSVLSGHGAMINDFLGATSDWEAMSHSQIKCLLAVVVAYPQSRDRIFEICKDLQSRGVPFCRINVADVIIRCFRGLWSVDNSASAGVLATGARLCLLLGVEPASTKRIWSECDELIAMLRKKTKIKKLIASVEPAMVSLIRLGISDGEKEFSTPTSKYKGETDYTALYEETQNERDSAWRSYRNGSPKHWVEQVSNYELEPGFKDDKAWMDHFSNDWSKEHFLTTWRSYTDEMQVPKLLEQPPTSGFKSLPPIYRRYVCVSPNHISVSDIESVKKIHSAHDVYPKSSWYGKLGKKLKSIAFVTDVEVYRHRRRAYGSAFSKSHLAAVEPLVLEYTNKFLHKVRARLDAGRNPDILDLSAQLGNDVMTEIILGVQMNNLESEADNPLIKDFKSMILLWVLRTLPIFLRAIVEILWVIPSPRLRYFLASESRVQNFGDAAFANIQKEIKKCKDGKCRQTFFAKLLEKAAEENGKSDLTSDIIKQEAGVLFGGGGETTSGLLAFLTWTIFKNKDIRRKILAELDSFEICNRYALEVSDDKLQKLPYLNAVITEGLRLFTTIQFNLRRIVPRGGRQLGEYFFPEGTEVSTPVYTVQRDPVIFPNPELFMPERWLEPTKDMEAALLAFGGKSRLCLGRNLAMMGLRLEIVGLLQLCPDAELADSCIDESMDVFELIITRPRNGKCELQKRSTSVKEKRKPL